MEEVKRKEKKREEKRREEGKEERVEKCMDGRSSILSSTVNFTLLRKRNAVAAPLQI